MERFYLMKLNDVEGKEQFCVEISNRFATLEDLDAEVESNSAWEKIGENINIPAKGSLGRPRQRCLDNIRMDLGQMEWGDVDWMGLVQDKDKWRSLVNLVLNFRVP
jgi:hypothetical protein